MKTNKTIIILALIASVFVSCTKITDVNLPTNPALQFTKSEWQISLKTNFINPYDAREIALDMVITTPSEKQLILPCFYVSGTGSGTSLWQARFTPRERGVYKYHFQLTKKGNTTSTTKGQQFSVEPTDKKGFLSANNLWTLKYDNGDLFRGLGENICWESRDSDDSKFFEALHEDKRFNYNYMLNKLAENGGNFFRTWMIYWNLPVDWKTPENNSRYQSTSSPYNESGMKRMDELVTLCDSLQIHMMLALESHVGLMGRGWDISSYNIKNGGPAKTPTEFFALPEARAQYKNKLRLMVARYGYSPSIAAWEFFNEVDNAMYTQVRIPDSLVADWHNEMSTYLKSIDPYKHLVTTSISHRDVEGMNSLTHLDFNQRHIYKYTDGIPSVIADYTQKYQKPYVIGEFGYEWDWSKNFNDFADDMDNDFRRGLWYGLFSPTPILPMSWWWEFFENRGTMADLKPVRILMDDMLQTGKGQFEKLDVTLAQNNLKAYAVTCGNKNYLYLYNPTDRKSTVAFITSKMPVSNNSLMQFDEKTGSFSPVVFTTKQGQLLCKNSIVGPKSDIILVWE